MLQKQEQRMHEREILMEELRSNVNELKKAVLELPMRVFWVRLDKSTGCELGLELDSALLVLAVDEGGLVADWNKTNPATPICIGSRIIEVNGEHNVRSILQRLVDDTVVHLTLIK